MIVFYNASLQFADSKKKVVWFYDSMQITDGYFIIPAQPLHKQLQKSG